MDQQIIYELASENEHTTVDRLIHLYWGLHSVLMADVPGDVVELGCNSGLTSVLFAKLLQHHAPERTLHVYDSFDGLPLPGERDRYRSRPMRDDAKNRPDPFRVHGSMRASTETLLRNFERWEARLPEIHPGWFNDVLPDGLPDKIAFAYLDSDLYDSILESLTAVYPRLAPGALIMVDDYADVSKNPVACNDLPAVYDACNEFLRDCPEQMYVLVGEHEPVTRRPARLAMGYFRKLG